MNNILSKIIPLIFMLMLFSCTYKPIFSEKNYNFKIDEILFKGEKDINKEIKQGLSLIKRNTDDNKNTPINPNIKSIHFSVEKTQSLYCGLGKSLCGRAHTHSLFLIHRKSLQRQYSEARTA